MSKSQALNTGGGRGGDTVPCAAYFLIKQNIYKCIHTVYNKLIPVPHSANQVKVTLCELLTQPAWLHSRKNTLKDIAEETRIKLFYARMEAKNKIDQDSNSRLSDL
jgi:hypothetical protein